MNRYVCLNMLLFIFVVMNFCYYRKQLLVVDIESKDAVFSVGCPAFRK